MRNGGAAHNNMEAPRNFDGASRRRHLERNREIFLALRSVSLRYCREATPWCYTHPLFIGLQGRFLTLLEMTIQESDVS